MRRSKEIFEEIERRKDLVVKEFRPEAVIPFGSFAKGDFNEGSEVEVMVIADFKDGFLERVELLWDFKDEIKLYPQAIHLRSSRGCGRRGTPSSESP
jgi:predicted nucleotidyltransferase